MPVEHPCNGTDALGLGDFLGCGRPSGGEMAARFLTLVSTAVAVRKPNNPVYCLTFDSIVVITAHPVLV